MTDNLVTLDLTRFSAADRHKLEALAKKVRLMRRWCRCELVRRDGHDQAWLYSGDRGRQPYACYRISRNAEGAYALYDGRDGNRLAESRAIDGVLDSLPDDFYYSRY